MKTLIELLTKETESLRVQYLAKVADWAKEKFEEYKKYRLWKEIDWCNYFGIEPELINKGTRNEFLGMPRNFYNGSKARIKRRLINTSRSLFMQGLEKFLAKEERAAQHHYENSIVKLAKRIEKKDLKQNSLKLHTSHVGVNINTTITDGEKSVRAFTIIARGDIQRPHYRYLVK